jgi:hypothetical protein
MIILLCKDEKAREEAKRIFSLKEEICFFESSEALAFLQSKKEDLLTIIVDLGMLKEEGFLFFQKANQIIGRGRIIGTYLTECPFPKD